MTRDECRVVNEKGIQFNRSKQREWRVEEWNIARLEDWKTGILEDWKIGTSFHYSTIPSFRVFTFHFSIIPLFHHSNTPTPSVFFLTSC